VTVGSLAAKVTNDPNEGSDFVAKGTPTVLVGEDAAALGQAIVAAPQDGGGRCLLAVMIGDLGDPVVAAAAAEMAGELWPWAGTGAAGAGVAGAGVAGADDSRGEPQ